MSHLRRRSGARAGGVCADGHDRAVLLTDQALQALELMLGAAAPTRASAQPAVADAELEELRRRLVRLLVRLILVLYAADTGRLPRGSDHRLLRELPGADDATARAVLDRLLRADGQPLPYRALSLEDIGRVHELLTGYRVRRLEAAAVCLQPKRIWVTAREILEQPPPTRSRWLQQRAGLPKSAVQRLSERLAHAGTEGDVLAALEPERARGTPRADAGYLALEPGLDRRRSGAHYTPGPLCERVVRRTLAPLTAGLSSEALLELRICDPAAGSGAFLVAACVFLGRELAAAWQREGRVEAGADPTAVELRARREVARRCLYGVDRNPVAVELARYSVAFTCTAPGEPFPSLEENFRTGDALVGFARDRDAAAPLEALLEALHEPVVPFHWPLELPEVFARDKPGFDACIGNPPWVAYAGRAAQPLARELAAYYLATSPAFHGFRTLHGLFIHRCATLLRPGGRLGLVVPTSVSDLDGYAPTRRAHDTLCAVDDALLDFGDRAFDAVFQPCMALTSTRRPHPVAPPAGLAPRWPLARDDLDPLARRLLERLAALPKLPPSLFGERGLQTSGDDLAHLRRMPAPESPYLQPLREGADIAEFSALPPTLFADTAGLRVRLRPQADWARVGVLIRQTARFPIAALADGIPFRNSILAGFADGEWTAHALLAYLNSSVVRWFHYCFQRDARQGMPQLKIGHLRALPSPIAGPAGVLERLDRIGRQLGPRNTGMDSRERAELDETACTALGLTTDERELVCAWAAKHPPPARRPRVTPA